MNYLPVFYLKRTGGEPAKSDSTGSELFSVDLVFGNPILDELSGGQFHERNRTANAVVCILLCDVLEEVFRRTAVDRGFKNFKCHSPLLHEKIDFAGKRNG